MSLTLVTFIVNVDTRRWSHLAPGTTVFLYSRGVRGYTSAFDHAMLESQLSVIARTTYTIHVDSRCAQIQLTSILAGIIRSILGIQRTLFPAPRRVAGSRVTEPSLAFSELTVTKPEFTIPTPGCSSRRVKLGLALFGDT